MAWLFGWKEATIQVDDNYKRAYQGSIPGFSRFSDHLKTVINCVNVMSTLAPLSAEKETVFPGFQVPNTTPIPEQLVDELLPILSGAEVKVVLYICRRTFGFKKQSDKATKLFLGAALLVGMATIILLVIAITKMGKK